MHDSKLTIGIGGIYGRSRAGDAPTKRLPFPDRLEELTSGGMDDLEQGNSLRPLRKLAHAGISALEARQRDEGHHASEDVEPEERADEVVEDEVQVLEGAEPGRVGLGAARGAWRRHSCDWDWARGGERGERGEREAGRIASAEACC